MIVTNLDAVTKEEFERGTGWAIKPQGACKDERCVPLGLDSGVFDARAVAERLNMPIVRDERTGLVAIGPDSGGRVLESAEAQDFTLPDWKGESFTLSSLRGRKVVLLAWASW